MSMEILYALVVWVQLCVSIGDRQYRKEQHVQYIRFGVFSDFSSSIIAILSLNSVQLFEVYHSVR